ncbi:MAG: hypothetical protein ACRDNG_00625 [Gaiellaceae bacterium]
MAPGLEQVLTRERFPLATRVGEAAAERYGGAYDAELGFTFGLQRLLDGVETLIAR